MNPAEAGGFNIMTKKEILKTECDADNLTILIKGFSDFDSLMFYYKNIIMGGKK